MSVAPIVATRWRRSAAVVSRIVLLAALAVGLVACGDPPEVPLGPDGQPDQVLATGRAVYGQYCSSCHGSSGGGGRGPALDGGRAAAQYPNIDDMIAVIGQGKGNGMPAFGQRLDEDQLLAVTRYIREVLS